MKVGNVHFESNQIPYDYIETIYNNLREIASLPPMKPTQLVKSKYPNINAESRKIYVKAVPNGIVYLVEDQGQISKNDIIRTINCKGYAIDLKEEKKLKPVSHLEKLAEIMNIKIGNDLIED